MKILSIETSCDETAVAYLEATGDESSATFHVLGNGLLSQIDIHKEYGGVFPALAKREHAKNLVAVLDTAVSAHAPGVTALSEATRNSITELLLREEGLADALLAFLDTHGKPELDVVAVTHGPGLAPALWVGVNFAKAVALAWELPIVGINHLEGHILSAFANGDGDTLTIQKPALPILGLGIAGGHTDLVLMEDWLQYRTIGGTLDDSVGEAFDKVARMLGLPYPGGPEISRLAEEARSNGETSSFTLPRPMMKSDSCDFSFSGLKTAVLYLLKKIPTITDADKRQIALEFENAAAEVLWAKTDRALAETAAKSLIVSGGVSANTHIRREFEKNVATDHPGVALHIPPRSLTTDNAIMIGMAGFYRALRKEFVLADILEADGNLLLPQK